MVRQMHTLGHVSRTMRSLLPLLLGAFLGLSLLPAFAAELPATPPGAPQEAAGSDAPAKLDIFGSAFFAGAPASFSVAPDTTVPVDYRLDVHDVLRIRYWTPVIAETVVEAAVNQAGTVEITGIGDVRAAKLTLDDFRKVLALRLREQLKNPGFTVDLVTPRTLVVYVVGAARRPGRYTVRADANLFNVIYAAGGAADEGSLRRIALRRKDRIVALLDAYQFLLDGALVKDIMLEDQDVVFFPPAGPRVALSGQVARPGIYEILDGWTVADALAMAGGLRASAYARLLRLQRVEDGVRVEKTLDATAIARDPKHADNLRLQDGDALAVENVSPTVLGKAVIRGNVVYPGSYSLARAPTVKALFTEAKVKVGTYWERADLLRALPDGTPVVVAVPVRRLLDGQAADIPLSDLDEVVVYTTDERVIIPLVTVEGAVKHPASYRLNDGMRISDLLFIAGGPLHDAAADVAHLYRRTGPDDYQVIRLSPAQIAKGVEAANPLLQDEDRLVVYRQKDVAYKAEMVAVLGEVQHPGEYRVFKNLTLYDLLLQAGGATDMAAGTVEVATPAAGADNPARTEVKVYPLAEAMGGARRDDPVTAGMLVSLPRQGDRLARPRQIELKGQFKRPGTYALLSDEETLTSVIERAGGFTGDADPFGLSLTRDREKMLSNASAQQVKTIMNALDQLLPPLEKTPAQGGNTASIVDMPEPALSAYTPMGQRTEKVLLVSPRRLTGMPTSNRVGFSMEDRKSYLDRLGKVRLTDGDVVEVPRKSQVVQVLGAVQSPGPVFYQSAFTTKDYLNRAGGGAQDADMKRAVIVKVSGAVQPLGQAREIDAGDVIVVPSKYQVVEPPTHRGAQDTLFNLLGAALVIRGLNL